MNDALYAIAVVWGGGNLIFLALFAALYFAVWGRARSLVSDAGKEKP
jgi:hypothetical protein